MKIGTTIMAAVAILISIPTAAQEKPAPASRWMVSDERVPLTGARALTAVLESSNELVSILGYPKRAALVVRCNSGSLAVHVNWVETVNYDGQNMMGQYKTMAMWRIDNGKIEGNLWDIDTTFTAAGEFKNKNALKLLSRLATARTFVVRLSGRQTQDAEFHIDGIDQIAANAAAVCGMALKR